MHEPSDKMAPGKRQVITPAKRGSRGRVIVMDLDVRGTDDDDQRFFDLNHRTARDFFFYRVDMQDLATSFMLYAGGSRFKPGMNMPNHISIVDCTSLSNSPTAGIVFSSPREMHTGSLPPPWFR